MEPTCVIYGLYCVCPSCSQDHPEEVRYVGQTQRGMKQRMAIHLTPYSLETEKFPVSKWKKAHGKENIRYKILEVCDTPEQLGDREVYWAQKLGTFASEGGRGLNLSAGAPGRRVNSSELSRRKEGFVLRGENAPWSKLTWDDVNFIRETYREGGNIQALAKKLGVSKGQARRIVTNQRWYDPTYTYEKMPPRSGEAHGASKVSDEIAWLIRNEREAKGTRLSELAEKYGSTVSNVQAICSGRRKGIPAVK